MKLELSQKAKVPKLRHHKATGLAYVVLNGHAVYLGEYGTEHAAENYRRTLAEWAAVGKQILSGYQDMTISELEAQFWLHAENYYRGTDGRPTSELNSLRYALRPLMQLYGNTRASDFGPRCLQALQQKMIETGWCRNNVNRSISRIKALFKWAVSREFLSGSHYHALSTVSGLRRGRSDARETEPIKPVPQEHIDAIKPYISRQLWTVIQLQLLTAARPSEILNIRPCDINQNNEIWTYEPSDHKTAHHGHSRTIYIGPQAQMILRPFLFRPARAYCFSPAEAYAERLAKAHANRKTPLSSGNVPGSHIKDNPQWQPGDHYDVAGYRHAITQAIERAFPAPACLRQNPFETKWQWKKRLSKKEKAELKAWYKQYHWHPHQLRHNAATFLRKEFGLETARIILGHRSSLVTEVYAEMDQQKAMDAIIKIG